jgi:hypothetical protein
MCSQCIDVTTQVKSNGTCRFNDPQYLNANSANATETETSQQILGCEYRIGENIIANGTMTIGVPNGYEYSMQGMIVSPLGLLTNDTEGPVYQQAAADLRLPGWRSPVFGFYRLMLNTSRSNSGSPLAQASECALNFCIQEHQLSMVGTSPVINTSTIALALFENDASSDGNITWVSPTTGNQSQIKDLDPDIYVPNREASWMTDALATVFEGTVSVNSTTSISGYGSDAMYAMYQPSVPFPEILLSVANSLTRSILDESKNIAPGGLASTYGSVESLETILIVRWEWLGLPAAILLGTAAFLTITVVNSHRRRVNVWKSSSLPFLYHSLDRPEDRAVAMDRVSDMEKDAQGLKVCLA